MLFAAWCVVLVIAFSGVARVASVVVAKWQLQHAADSIALAFAASGPVDARRVSHALGVTMVAHSSYVDVATNGVVSVKVCKASLCTSATSASRQGPA